MSRLSDHALLVRVYATAWGASKLDRGASAQTAEHYNAAASAVKTRTLLVPKEALDPITKVITTLRTDINKITAPWADTGERLLPLTKYDEFISVVAARKADFEVAVAGFAARYPNDVREAYVRLGSLFDRSNYPPLNVLLKKFVVDVTMTPVPHGGHLTLAVSDTVRTEVQNNVERSTRERFENAIKAALDSLSERAMSLSASLTSENGRVKGATIDGLIAAARMLDAVNLYQHPDVHKIAHTVINMLDGMDPEALRTDPAFRQSVASAVSQSASQANVMAAGQWQIEL